MYKVKFYRDKNGNEPVREYLKELAQKNDKDSRINLNKIRDYVKALSLYGKDLGEPYIKHIDGPIWKLRPLRNRILFFAYDGKQFILLSYFIKKTKRTPKREIEKAKKLMNEYIERMSDDE